MTARGLCGSKEQLLYSFKISFFLQMCQCALYSLLCRFDARQRQSGSNAISLHFFLFPSRSDVGRGSPKPDLDSRDLLEDRVPTRVSAASPTGAHVADIYLANLNKCVLCADTSHNIYVSVRYQFVTLVVCGFILFRLFFH